jgi:hypothetical protein
VTDAIIGPKNFSQPIACAGMPSLALKAMKALSSILIEGRKLLDPRVLAPASAHHSAKCSRDASVTRLAVAESSFHRLSARVVSPFARIMLNDDATRGLAGALSLCSALIEEFMVG